MGAMLLTAAIDNKFASRDMTPVLFLSSGYEPMYKSSWKRAITAVFCGRAEVLEEHDSYKIFTSSGAIPFPTVVRYTSGVLIGKIKNISKAPKVTKKNIWLRDGGRCQYCEKKISLSDATVDHVIPKSRGGENNWENVTLACSKCNQKKGNKLLENSSLKISRKPFKPSMDNIFVK